MTTKRKKDEAAARAVIERTDWLLYLAPNQGITVHIKRTLLEKAEVEVLAAAAKSCAERLRQQGFRFGQQEIHLRKPVRMTLHTLIDGGRYYLSDQEFFAYH